MVIFLCGFMGCGKSTVGKELAKLMGNKFIDMDIYIETKENMSIPEIFAQKGEPYFRQIEAETVVELSKSNAIVGCGGGAMLNSTSAEIGRRSGVVIFLDVPFSTCYDRIKNDSNRPIVMNNSKEQLEQIFNGRRSIYQANSSFKVDVDSNVSPFENARTINSLVKLLVK
ncbi:MAG: shikimate kinase [Ruminococcus sp.]|nr:shikimate kinase [Ruminococcus sp.]MCD7799841.1 shikimate kinase [Ruminococcus sp.]